MAAAVAYLAHRGERLHVLFGNCCGDAAVRAADGRPVRVTGLGA
ncbi:hypothetical protein [Streptomyces sp. NPDC047706]